MLSFTRQTEWQKPAATQQVERPVCAIVCPAMGQHEAIANDKGNPALMLL